MSDDVPSNALPAPASAEPGSGSLSRPDASEPASVCEPTTAQTSTEAAPATATATATGADGQPLSKKAQKKLAKSAYIAERKKERRAAEKERKKEKRREYAQKRDAGELDPEELERERERKRQKTERQGARTPFGARVVVDLGFDEKMTENEVKSLTSQLAYTYSANKKSVHPFASLLFTSLDGKTKARMDGTSNSAYKRWVGAEWWEEGYEQLWEGEQDQEEDVNEVKEDGETGGEGAEVVDGGGKDIRGKRTKQQQPSRAEKNTVVYLTADSEEELMELKEGETYIIGGIVDHNRYKNLCLDKSQKQGVRSARLPIGTYLTEMRTRKVLTVNQTFEILLKWVEMRNWEQSLYTVMPKRKFNTEGRRRGGGAASSKDAESVIEEGEGGTDIEVNGEDGDAEVVNAADLEDRVEYDAEDPVSGPIVIES